MKYSRSPRWPLAGCALVVLVMIAPSTSTSTTLMKFGVEQMTRLSVMVVQGHVAWDYSARPDPDGPIYTYTGIEVDRCVAGYCPETVTLKHQGGTVEDLTLFISGMPRFTPGDEVLLFLENDPEGVPDMYYTVGMVQGYFRIHVDAEDGTKTAVQQLGGITMAEPDETGLIKPVGNVGPIVLELDYLIARVRAEWKKAEDKKKGGDA